MNANREPICGDPAALAGYLYDECSLEEQAALTAHLAMCDRCRLEVDGLHETRLALTAWAAPDASPGVRALPDPPRVAGPRRWNWSAAPVWAQAAAAVFVFAIGAAAAAVMNVDVRYDATGLTVRTGWGERPVPAVAAAAGDARTPAAVSQAQAAVSRPVEAAAAAATPATALQPATSEELLRRVEQMLAASESRQQRELALRVSQVLHDVDSQHRADMARIERTVSPVAGLTAEEIQEQRQMLNYLMRVSQTK